MVLRLVRQPYADFPIENLFANLFSDVQSTGSAHIRLDVREHQDRYELVAELPGVAKEDLRIGIENGLLTISGERKPIERNGKARLVHAEIPTGVFERSLVIPKDVDAAKLDAELSGGILTLTMPKAEQSLPREIKVK